MTLSAAHHKALEVSLFSGDGRPDGPSVVHSAPVPLTTLGEGALGVLDAAQVDPGDAALLRAMGLVGGATLRVCRQGSPCIVAVMNPGARVDGGGGHEQCPSCACGGSRIGLAHDLARRVMVRPIGPQ